VVEGASPVIAFVGDAGLEMCLGELSTLRDLKIPVIICVLVDTSLSLIELKQRSSQRPNVGVDFGETDFPAVARAYGGHGVWVEDAETLHREAEDALAREGFTLLACRIERRAYDGTF
jgi:acetolactate synthase-1/2/3 large subunit